jgi:hypothetical protein
MIGYLENSIFMGRGVPRDMTVLSQIFIRGACGVCSLPIMTQEEERETTISFKAGDRLQF